ncbi:MAG: glucosamine-6-phosphate deaminase [Planctomycetes bacterium]|nr:glucosamine-6-phosphate deaminase [Planctomycetota bacterium]
MSFRFAAEILLNPERVPVQIFEDDKQACRAVGAVIAQLVEANNAMGKSTVLGLATGHTPVNVYAELIRRHRDERLDMSRVITFNLDEYYPIEPSVLQSYHTWMHENLFKHVNIRNENIHIPRGDLREDEVESFCAEYERQIAAAGGIDLQILGIGRSGHIGFNEPGSSRDSRTRLVRLDTITRKDAASDFFGEKYVPHGAITMGIATILSARRICLLAFGEQKSRILQLAVEGELDEHVAASFLQEHHDCTYSIDVAAAGCLTRVATPWLTGHCQWDDVLQRRAVIWLSQKLGKATSKLTAEDYAESGLAELVKTCGSVDDLNRTIFRRLMGTITNRPVGKNGKRRVVVLSAHPDDDVICMGGTLIRMAEQGHEVHIAYMVSGYLSVFDHDVSRHADFVHGFNAIFGLAPEESARIEQHIDTYLHRKKPGDIDSPEIQNIKALIRRGEAVAAAKVCGIEEDHLHFLNMPFYNTGRVQKLSIGGEDVAVIRQLIESVRPEVVFAAGDMSDPHGTHRLCLEAAMEAIDGYTASGGSRPVVWLYRGAWQEWEPQQIDMAIPISSEETRRKRDAIFRHESQKDKAMFPGPYDNREFWQRAAERNRATAQTYDALGLPEYHALEAFVRYPLVYSINYRRQLVETGDDS